MNTKLNQIVALGLIAAGIIGCQSGPRWAQMPTKLAWWKKDAPATDASLVARSAGAEVAPPADPVLPSTVATPQTLSAATAPPSAKSVAVDVPAVPPVASMPATSIPAMTTAPTTTIPASTIPASSAATIASAPTATYPTTAIPTTTASTSPLTSPIAAAPAPTTPPTAAMVQDGPYDPNAYQATTAPTTPTNAIAQVAVAEDDRYGAMSTASPAPSADDRYAYNPSAATPSYSTSVTDDRYSMPSAATAVPVATPSTNVIAPASVTAPASPAATPYSTPTAPQSSTPSYNPASVAASTVRIDAPAGQYRPGGTSTFTGFSTTSVEVASRPTSATPTTSPPLPSNVPIYPTGNNSTRTY